MVSVSAQNRVPAEHRQVLDDRAQGQGGEEGQAADDQDHADQQAHEQRAVGRAGCPATARRRFLAASEPATASIGTIMPKRPSSMPMPRVVL